MPKTVFVICNHTNSASKFAAARDAQELEEYDYNVTGSHIFDEHEMGKFKSGLYNDPIYKMRRDVRLLARADGICVDSDYFTDPYVLRLFTIAASFPWINPRCQNVVEWIKESVDNHED